MEISIPELTSDILCNLCFIIISLGKLWTVNLDYRTIYTKFRTWNIKQGVIGSSIWNPNQVKHVDGNMVCEIPQMLRCKTRVNIKCKFRNNYEIHFEGMWHWNQRNDIKCKTTHVYNFRFHFKSKLWLPLPSAFKIFNYIFTKLSFWIYKNFCNMHSISSPHLGR